MSSTKREWFLNKLGQVCEACPGESVKATLDYIQRGRILVRMAVDDGVPVGFATFSVGDNTLKVHHVYAEPGRWDVLPGLIEEGRKIMSDTKCKTMEVMTQNPDALLRRLSPFGFTKSPYTTLTLGGDACHS